MNDIEGTPMNPNRTPRRDHLADGPLLRDAARADQRRMFGLIRSMGAVFGRASVAELEAVAEQTVEHYDEAYLAMSRALDVETDCLRDRIADLERLAVRAEGQRRRSDGLLREALVEQRARSRKQGRPLPVWAERATVLLGSAEEPF